MDGGAGPSSLELTVTGTDGKAALYAAAVTAHITYCFGGIRRLDLETGTNSDGKVKFTGLSAECTNLHWSFMPSQTRHDLGQVESARRPLNRQRESWPAPIQAFEPA